MTDQPADEVFEAVLDGKPDVGFVRGMGYAVLSALATLGVGNAVGIPGDVVVRRKADGREVLRIDAGADDAAAHVLAQMRQELETVTEAEFRAAHDVDGPG